MNNEDNLLDILSLIRKHYKFAENKAVLFLAGDLDLEVATVESQGNIKVLGELFTQKMSDRPEFNQLMKALMGSYLSQHPEEKKEFIRGLESIGVDPNMN